MAFQILSASKDAYNNSFFPQTIRDWNDLPMIASVDFSDDYESKFISLVRARDKFPQSQPLVKDCHFGVSPVDY